MTNQQREKITELRGQGLGYTAIANAVGLSKDSVKAYCRSHHLGKNTDNSADYSPAQLCLHCGKELVHTPGKGRRNSAARNADRHGGIHIRRRSGEERSIPSPAVIAASLSPLTATAVENTAVMIAIFLTGSGAVTADEQRRITERYALSRRPFNCRRNACEPPDYRTGIR